MERKWPIPALGLMVVAMLAVGVLLILQYTSVGQFLTREQLRALFESIADHSLAAPLFVLTFALGLCLGFPGSPFIMVGGVVFGVWPGALLNWLGAVLGASGAFGIGRMLGRGVIQRILGPRLTQMDRAIARNGFWAVFMVRLIPAIPFNLSNFALGVTGIGLRPYVLGTGLAMAPGLVITSWFARALWEGTAGDRAITQLVLASCCMLLLALIPWGYQRWQARRIEARLAELTDAAASPALTAPGGESSRGDSPLPPAQD